MVLIFGSVVFMASCQSNTIAEISPIVTNPTYVANIKPIFDSQCTSCHSNGDRFPDLTTYAKVRDAVENGNVLCRINGSCGGIMPQSGKMSQVVLDEITTWKNLGYIN